MSNRMTLEEVEQVVTQLTVPERLQLVARICEHLSTAAAVASEQEKLRRERLAQVDAWLAECDTVAESIAGEFDAAADIRRSREERANHL